MVLIIRRDSWDFQIFLVSCAIIKLGAVISRMNNAKSIFKLFICWYNMPIGSVFLRSYVGQIVTMTFTHDYILKKDHSGVLYVDKLL